MWPHFRTPTRREIIGDMLRNEQVRGSIILTKAQGKLRARKATDIDRTWAVRDYEQTKRQRKRDRWGEKFRPILTRRTLVKMRTTEWEWT